MKTYINNISEALLLMEMPYINPHTTKIVFSNNTKNINKLISDIHKSSNPIKLGDDEYVCNYNDTYVYYHLISDIPKEYSIITRENEQTLTSKDVDGNVNYIHNFMKHHIETHGLLYSSYSNTRVQ